VRKKALGKHAVDLGLLGFVIISICMGNQNSTRSSKGATARRDLELPSLHPIRVLNSHTTFTTFLCAYADGTHVVVKRASRDDVGADHASYREAMRTLEERLESASMASTSHVWADQQIIETTGAVHVVRQYFAQSLASRPLCATFEEKLWIAWQILWGLRCVRACCHCSVPSRSSANWSLFASACRDPI
jgi:hypothetical protein